MIFEYILGVSEMSMTITVLQYISPGGGHTSYFQRVKSTSCEKRTTLIPKLASLVVLGLPRFFECLLDRTVGFVFKFGILQQPLF